MRTYKIHLIRHGLTQANLDGRYCGDTDLPLCEEGRRQLIELMDKYDYPYVDAVYSSPLTRARETAEILFPGCEYTAVTNLREVSFGEFEGKTMEQLKDNEDYKKWVVPGKEFTPAGMEPPKAFYVRCREGIIQVVDHMMQNGITSAAVVTHAGVISAIMAALVYPKYTQYDWNALPGMGYTLRADPSLFLREPVLEFVEVIPKETVNHDDDDPFDTEG